VGAVGGWDQQEDCAIYSNEVRNLATDVLVVKSRKNGELARGPWKEVKGAVTAYGGRYEQRVYLGYRGPTGALQIGVLPLSGIALKAWLEAGKTHKKALLDGAVEITGSVSGRKGSVTYHEPTFGVRAIDAQTHQQAVALDMELQQWMRGHLTPHATPSDEPDPRVHPARAERRDVDSSKPALVLDDEIPFAWLLPPLMATLSSLAHAVGGVA
jgi:hypothetical protein